MREISDSRPEGVILFGSWAWNAADEIGLTIERLKSLGIKEIILIGPLLRWNKPVPRIILSHYYFTKGEVPLRINNALDVSRFKIDSQLEKVAAHYHIQYISPIKILCNVDGCQIRSPSFGIFQFDEAHLTSSGGNFLVNHFPRPLIESPDLA